MLSKFFRTQWKYPTNKKDWTELVKSDLDEFEIPADLEFIVSKSKWSWANLVKVKSKEVAWKKFMEAKMDHSKMDNLWYSQLRIQEYLQSNKFSTQEVKTIFKFRTRMASFGENFRNGQEQVPCPLCNVHLDSQPMAFQCTKIKSEIQLRGKYEDLFKDIIPEELVKTLCKIEDYRTKYLEERTVKCNLDTWIPGNIKINCLLGHWCTRGGPNSH